MNKPYCNICKFFVFSPSIGWHCFSGFRPKRCNWYDCQKMCADNYKNYLRMIRCGYYPDNYKPIQLRSDPFQLELF